MRVQYALAAFLICSVVLAVVLDGTWRPTNVIGNVLPLHWHRYHNIIIRLSFLKPFLKHAADTPTLQSLAETIRGRIEAVTFPRNCATAKFLSLSIGYDRFGFSSTVHGVAAALMLAVRLNRTLYITTITSIDRVGGWSAYLHSFQACPAQFQNLTDKDDFAIDGASSYELIHAPRITAHYRPVASHNIIKAFKAPPDLGPAIRRLHSQPEKWYISQFLRFVFMPSTAMSARIERTRSALNITSPYVGIHVRRTDKVFSGEASHFNLSEYLGHAEVFFASSRIPKKVYLSSDDPDVFVEANSKFKDYEFIIGDARLKTITSRQNYEAKQLELFIQDLYFLSQSIFFVGTFSSKVGRLVSELMQGDKDATQCNTVSLDDPYFFESAFVSCNNGLVYMSKDERYKCPATLPRRPEIASSALKNFCRHDLSISDLCVPSPWQ